MEKLFTKRQKELLGIIYDYIKSEGYPPTIGEMKEQLGVSSNQSVLDLLQKLKERGAIRKNESAARGLSILPVGYEVLGQPPLAAFLGATSAGAPIEAIEISGEWQTVSPQVARFAEEVFLLKIAGDSMINAGIEDGDVVLVKREKEFISGDVVLTEMRGEATIKRFISSDVPPYLYLKPENPKYPNISLTHEMRLTGKVLSVLKQNYWRSIK
jgi:repressor LexA